MILKLKFLFLAHSQPLYTLPNIIIFFGWYSFWLFET